MDTQNKQKFLINIAFAVTWALIVYFIMRFTLKYMFPFVIALIFAFMVQKPAKYISGKICIKKQAAALILVLLFYLLLIGAAALLFWLVGIKGISAISQMYINKKSIAETTGFISGKFEKIVLMFPDSFGVTLKKALGDTFGMLFEKAAEFVSVFAANFAKLIPGIILGITVSAVAGCYFAKDYDKLLKFLKSITGSERYGKIRVIKDIIINNVFKIIGGYLILAGITFAELTVGFLILKIKFPVFIALIISLVDLLPILGAGVVILPWGIIEIITGNIGKGIGLIILFVLVTVIRNFAEPKIIGKQTDINPLLILITIFVGLKISGVFGMFFLPLTVITVISYYKREIDSEKPYIL